MTEYTRNDINQAALDGNLDRVDAILSSQPELANAGHPVHTDRYPIQYAARRGHVEVVRRLLEAGADPSGGGYPINESANALAVARDRGHKETVDLITDWLAKQRGVQPDSSRFCDAIRSGDTETFSAMLQCSRNLVNTRTEDDSTPLHTAVECGNISLIFS